MSNHGAQSNRVFRRDAKYCVSTHNRKTALLPKMFKTFLVVRLFCFNCLGIFILFMRVTGWHGLFPSPTGIEDRSWEGTPQFPSWERTPHSPPGGGWGWVPRSPLPVFTRTSFARTSFTRTRAQFRLVLVKTGIRPLLTPALRLGLVGTCHTGALALMAQKYGAVHVIYCQSQRYF